MLRTVVVSVLALSLLLIPLHGDAASKKRKAGNESANTEPAPPPAPVAPVMVLDKDLTKELARGALLDQLESKGKLTKNFYTPPPKLLLPYKDAAIGSAVAFEIVENERPFANAPLAQEYAQRVVNRLLAALPDSPPSIPVRIVASPDYGAAATETGMILVNLGTFDVEKGAASTDELAVLLGHEVGHILLGHLSSNRAVRTLSGMLKYAASTTIAYSSIKGGRFVNGKFQGKGDKDMMLKGLVAGLATSTLVEDLLAPSFNRNRELEADRIGIDLALRAKFAASESEMLTFIGRHGEDDLRRSRRVEALRLVVNAMMSQVAARASKEAGNSAMGLVKNLISVSSQAMSEQILQLILKQTKDHPDPKERQAFASQYMKRYHPDAGMAPGGSLIKRDSRSMRAVCKDAALVTLIASVRRATEIRIALAQVAPLEDADEQAKSVRAALKQAGVAVAVEPAARPSTGRKGATSKREAIADVRPGGGMIGADPAAITWEMQGTLYMIDGTTGAAQGAWRRGLRSDFASVDMAHNFDGTMSGDGAAAERDAVIARYGNLIGTTDPVLDLVVESAVVRKDMAAAEVAAARCSTYAKGKLYPQCAVALGYDPMAKGQSAQTAEGRQAFASKGIERSFRTLTSLKGLFD